MVSILSSLIRKPVTEPVCFTDEELEKTGESLKREIHRAFGRSIMIREVDCGSDNAAEIELSNLSGPYYDIERFGISFVASPRHADILAVTGVVTRGMELALQKTYDATPDPKYVIAIGDDACTGGIYAGTYAVRGGVDSIIPVDLRILGNPPKPLEILRGILALMEKAGR